MSSKIVTLEQHLDYEAIIQIAEIEDQDLLYLNFDNQALGKILSASKACTDSSHLLPYACQQYLHNSKRYGVGREQEGTLQYMILAVRAHMYSTYCICTCLWSM